MHSETAWLLIATATIANVVAQSCLKLAHHPETQTSRRPALFAAAIILLSSGLIFYALSLEALDLKAAYTVLVGGTVGGVAIVSNLLLKERFSNWHVFGLCLIVLGVAFVKLGSSGMAL